MLKMLRKGVSTVIERIGDQGIRTTALWAYARGVPKITGAPLLKYSRITASLYVGPQHRDSGRRALQDAGFTHIVNMRSEFDDAAHGLTLRATPASDYCYLPTIDDEPISSARIAKGIAFIDSAIENGGKVYIHCSAGVGRAPSMAAAYLISKGYTAEQALDLIRTHRPFIRPTPKQINALQQLETELKATLQLQ